MLIEFTVGNYRSFLDPVTLSLEAAPLKAEEAEVDTLNLFERDQIRLLKVACLYGANASGKSNLIRALHTMVHFVRNSSRGGQVGDLLPVDGFRLRQDMLGRPCHFEIVLLAESEQFRYGFEMNLHRVEKEWLYRRPFGARREHRLFDRNGEEYRMHRAFSEGRELRDMTRDNALHLSVCAQFGGEISTRLMVCFETLNVGNGLDTSWLLPKTIKKLEQPASRNTVCQLVQRLDVDILDLQIVHERVFDNDTPSFRFSENFLKKLFDEGIQSLETVHVVRGVGGEAADTTAFRLSDESEGTRKLVELTGVLVDTLERGSVLVLDELDARLHPHMSRELVRLFQSPESNPRNAQLLFTTHDTNLLQRTIFRRDQIWFVEKDRKKEASDLYSLAEIRLESGKSVRNDARFERDYLQGRYGAVPFFGNLEAIVGEALRASFAEEDDG